MLADANLVLRDGTVDLDNNEVVATSLTRNDDGAIVLDLMTGKQDKTLPRGGLGYYGPKVMVASMILPDIPTTYEDTLAVVIQESDNLEFGWETIASFPTLYAYTRLLSVLVTTAFVAADIGETLTGGTTGDTGVIRWMHPDLLTVGNTANMIVTMVGSDDLFDNVDEVVTSGGTGAGTMNGAAIVENPARYSGPGEFHRAFGISKRYVRGQLSASAGSNFGNVFLALTPYPLYRA